NIKVLTNLKTIVIYIEHLVADDIDKAHQEIGQESDVSMKRGVHLYDLLKILARGEKDLYSGATTVVWERINQQWPVLKKSLIFKCQFMLIESLHLQARAALAMAKEVADNSSYLSVAEKNAGRIKRERTSYGDGWAELLLAGIAATRGRDELAIAHLNTAEKKFEVADMALYAAAARRRRGELLA